MKIDDSFDKLEYEVKEYEIVFSNGMYINYHCHESLGLKSLKEEIKFVEENLEEILHAYFMMLETNNSRSFHIVTKGEFAHLILVSSENDLVLILKVKND